MKNGTILNNTYRIIKPIGMGGLGEIYLGYHENLQKDVVIKKVKDHCTSLTNNRTEVDILKGLHHTYLPQVYDFIEIDDGIFTVMDYISGHDLKYYIDHGYQFPEEQLIFWMKQLCQVLDYLHSKKPKIIHCDIKPANIMITEDGNVCLIDFNISLDGENNKDLVGLSSFFASPEQVKKAEYKQKYGSGDLVKMDERTDLYSVGAVFYYMMCGKKPNARTGDTLLLKEMPHAYSESLENIVDKAMAPNPAKRFKSAAKMLNALENQEKWTTQYLKLWKTSIIMDSAAASLGLILICFMVLGYRGMKNETFYREYDAYIENVEIWTENQNSSLAAEDESFYEEADDIVSKGIELLNQNDYAKMFEKNPEQKAEILHRMGQASLYMGDYNQAKTYIEDSLKYEPDNAIGYRDLAVVQAKRGKIRAAKENLEQAMDLGLSSSEGILLMAEIALAEEDYKSAWEYAKEAAESKDKEIVERASYYILKSGEMLGNTAECVTFLEQQKKQSDGVTEFLWLRKLGELYFELYNDGTKSYISDAWVCYEELYNSGYAQLNDLYNLVSCYMESGKLRKAEELLLSMEDDYPDEYKIPMRLAYVCFRQQNEKTSSSRNYKEMKRYFEKAKDICGRREISWKADSNMLQLEELIHQLEVQGWLK